MAGSLLMLASIIVLGLSQGTFDMRRLGHDGSNDWIFLGFVAAFAVKAPLFPFHGWLPDAYREAPPEVVGRALGRRLEGGRVRLPADRDREVPRAGRTTSGRRSSCSRRSGSSTARCSRSARPTCAASIAYSSLAQMGLITLGLFATNDPASTARCCRWSTTGSISAALFLLAGAVERRAGDRRASPCSAGWRAGGRRSRRC